MVHKNCILYNYIIIYFAFNFVLTQPSKIKFLELTAQKHRILWKMTGKILTRLKNLVFKINFFHPYSSITKVHSSMHGHWTPC